tara:strand:- start:476 stop:838 length:363 start_codon:yes stop_codon:yes gene_type:complete
MTLESMYHLIQSGEGFSVKPCGMTYTGSGYAVGGAEDCKLFKCPNDTLSFIAFKQEFEKIQASSHGDPYQVIGGWVDDHGVVYLELSDVVRSHYVAMELAKARQEKAIYDFANAKSIEVH